LVRLMLTKKKMKQKKFKLVKDVKQKLEPNEVKLNTSVRYPALKKVTGLALSSTSLLAIAMVP